MNNSTYSNPKPSINTTSNAHDVKESKKKTNVKPVDPKLSPLIVTLFACSFMLIMSTLTIFIGEFIEHFVPGFSSIGVYICYGIIIFCTLCAFCYSIEYKTQLSTKGKISKENFILYITAWNALFLTFAVTIGFFSSFLEYSTSDQLQELMLYTVFACIVLIGLLTLIGICYEQSNPNIKDKQYTKGVVAFGAGVAIKKITK